MERDNNKSLLTNTDFMPMDNKTSEINALDSPPVVPTIYGRDGNM